MSNSVKKHPIKVGILEISSQNRAILEFFFSGAGKPYFSEVDLDKASAYIIDYDSPGAKESWESIFNETKKPGIIISIREVDLPSTIWLQKPLTVKALTDAGETIRQMMLDEASLKLVNNITEITTEDTIQETEKTSRKNDAAEEFSTETDIVSIMTTEDASEDFPDLVTPLETLDASSQSQEVDIETNLEIPSLNNSSDNSSERSSANTELTAQENITLKDNADIFTELQETIQKDEKTHRQEDPLEIKQDFIVINTEKPKEELSLVDTPETQISDEPVITLTEEPEIPVTDMETEDASPLCPSSEHLIDFDLSLKEPDNKDLKKADEQMLDLSLPDESSDDALEVDESLVPNEDDIDSLLESLVSGEDNDIPVIETHEAVVFNKETEIPTSHKPLELDNIEIMDLETETPTETIPTNDLDESHDITQVDITDSVQATIELNDVSSEEELITTEETHLNEVAVESLSTKEKKQADTKAADDELQHLLEEIQQEAGGGNPATNANVAPSNKQKTAIPKNIPLHAKKRLKALCGDSNTHDLKKITYFDPSNHFISPLVQTINLSKEEGNVLRMKLNGILVVVDPNVDQIYFDHDITSDFYANLCYEPISLDKIKVHPLDESEIRLYSKKMKEDAEKTHTIEAFIWTASLLTSRGRLPQNTHLKKNIGLTSWPNLTRVEAIPHMMKIAALFDKNTWSLSEIIEKSEIQKNHIIAFYNAVLALGVLQINGKTINLIPFELNTDNEKNDGFLSRFIKKLTV